MGRQIIINSPASQKPVALKTVASIAPLVSLSKPELERRLRLKRSKAFVEAMTKLDAGCHLKDPNALNALIAAIQEELPEITIDKLPVGIVARCYLGDGHDVHTLDRTGGVLTHFKTWQSLPPLLERARSLALHAEYALVEVYVDSLCAIRATGEVSVITL
ncbi:MAG: hypothetical protein HY735_08775 [Verrucomicrobia bacterium]|nr:hypothetical protein [Verrucomicrobiota bacterium]